MLHSSTLIGPKQNVPSSVTGGFVCVTPSYRNIKSPDTSLNLCFCFSEYNPTHLISDLFGYAFTSTQIIWTFQGEEYILKSHPV